MQNRNRHLHRTGANQLREPSPSTQLPILCPRKHAAGLWCTEEFSELLKVVERRLSPSIIRESETQEHFAVKPWREPLPIIIVENDEAAKAKHTAKHTAVP